MVPTSVSQSAIPMFEWYCPDRSERDALPKFTRWAVDDGLLLLRPLT